MEVLTYQCPNCGAPLTFNNETQRWDCHFCQGSFDANQVKEQEKKLEEKQKPGPTVQEPAAESEQEAAQREEQTGKVYVCPNCGAEMITDDTTAASFCAFCGSPAIFPQQLSDGFRPQKVIPFRYGREEAIQALHTLCKRKPLLPKDFTASSHIEKVTGVYVPFWLYDCDVDVDLRAAAQRITSWSDSTYRYTKTDHYRVEREGRMSIQQIPADGSKKMDNDMMDHLEPFDYSQLTDFQMSYLSGYFAERYDEDQEICWPRAQERIDREARRQAEATVQGYAMHQTLSFQADYANKAAKYAMLPVWVLSTQYRGKNYLFTMNGQTGKMVGKLPMSWARAAALFGLSFAIVFLITLLGGALAW